MTTVNIIVRSEYYGAGKTHTCISFRRPDDEHAPKRLVYDAEFRDAPFQSPDSEDHPELLQFAFDIWQKAYGEDIKDSLIEIAKEINDGTFEYSVIVFDTASIFQDEIRDAMYEKQGATELCQAFGAYNRNASFLKYRFNVNDAAGFYFMIKSVIRAFLLLCRKNGIDVLVASESRNVWKNYGSRDKNNPPTILGQTAKLWDPWFQLSDLLLVLERMAGSRADGTAKLTSWPKATLDTFNPKCSIPGIAPEFYFKNWDVFWDMAEKRIAPTEEEYGEINIAASQEAKNAGFETISEAKLSIVAHAIKTGFITDRSKDEVAKITAAAEAAGLDPDNALAEYFSWIGMIDDNI